MTTLLGRIAADARVRVLGAQRVADSISPAIAALPVPGRCRIRRRSGSAWSGG